MAFSMKGPLDRKIRLFRFVATKKANISIFNKITWIGKFLNRSCVLKKLRFILVRQVTRKLLKPFRTEIVNEFGGSLIHGSHVA